MRFETLERAWLLVGEVRMKPTAIVQLNSIFMETSGTLFDKLFDRTYKDELAVVTPIAPSGEIFDYA